MCGQALGEGGGGGGEGPPLSLPLPLFRVQGQAVKHGSTDQMSREVQGVVGSVFFFVFFCACAHAGLSFSVLVHTGALHVRLLSVLVHSSSPLFPSVSSPPRLGDDFLFAPHCVHTLGRLHTQTSARWADEPLPRDRCSFLPILLVPEARSFPPGACPLGQSSRHVFARLMHPSPPQKKHGRVALLCLHTSCACAHGSWADARAGCKRTCQTEQGASSSGLAFR